MRVPDLRSLNIGPRLTLTFVALLTLILGGNALLIWQFYSARIETDRLIGLSQQLIAVLRIQESLLTFHQRLDDLQQSRNTALLTAESEPLRQTLLEQIAQARNVLVHLPPGTLVDPAFIPTLDAIEVTLPSQLEAVFSLARASDWDAVHSRLANELKPLETQTSALVDRIDQGVSRDLQPTITNARIAQRRILLIVPTTACCTFLIAAFFGWTITRRILQLRMEERVNERTRIARDLHDTLLQGLISAGMQMDVALDQLPANSPARPSFARVLELMRQVIEEGRNAIQGFRSTESETQELAEAFSSVPQELNLQERIDFRVITEGRPLSLFPLIRDDIYLIGREALVNAFRHARATAIEVEVEYSPNRLRVLVRDNGSGMDTEMLQGGRDRHWGLSGMGERAKRIGAKFKVLSRPGAGTEVELCVPARVAFQSHGGNPVSRHAESPVAPPETAATAKKQ